jgi:hypothetical protein
VLQHPVESRELAARGRERVRERFLLPRLIADELRLYRSILGREPAAGAQTNSRAPSTSRTRRNSASA